MPPSYRPSGGTLRGFVKVSTKQGKCDETERGNRELPRAESQEGRLNTILLAGQAQNGLPEGFHMGSGSHQYPEGWHVLRYQDDDLRKVIAGGLR